MKFNPITLILVIALLYPIIKGFIFEYSSKNLKEDEKSKNAVNEGRPPKLDNKALFMMLMIFYRHYPTFELLAFMFELNVSNVKRWIVRCELTLKSVLAKKNFSHLIVPNHDLKSREPLSDAGKSILMALNNLSADQVII